MIPTVRSADHARRGLRLAADLGCPLVVLCSGVARADEVMAAADGTAAGCRAVDCPAGYAHPLLEFGTSDTSEWSDAAIGRFRDLSLKRNIALLLARLAGWNTVLLLDDDVERLGAARVRWAATGLRSAAVVAFAMSDYPDHSVVCHAYRLGGGRQDVFVTGGACLLDVSRVGSFFPAVYNEDWLFLLDVIWRGQLANAGDVGQLPYQPFADPGRARAEEFGDVLAEGLLDLVHRRLPLAAANDRYWARLLDERAAFIERTRSLLGPRAGHDVRARDAVRALAAAEDRRSGILAHDLPDYVTVWRQDVDRWRARLASLPRLGSLDSALDYLGLPLALRTPAVHSDIWL